MEGGSCMGKLLRIVQFCRYRQISGDRDWNEKRSKFRDCASANGSNQETSDEELRDGTTFYLNTTESTREKNRTRGQAPQLLFIVLLWDSYMPTPPPSFPICASTPFAPLLIYHPRPGFLLQPQP